MLPVEIIFVILGILLLLVSCFLTGKENNPEKNSTVSLSFEELPEEQKKNMEQQISRIIESRTEEIIVKTDDYLSKISNEKIMAVNDFTDQIMQRVDKNNEEIVFLYKRLMEKEDEIKATIQSMETVKQDMKESVEDVVRLTRQLNASLKKAEKKPQEKTASVVKQDNAVKAEHEKAKTTSTGKKKTAAEQPAEQMELPEMMQPDNKNDEILKLYKQGKSVLEISKALGLGQGEVKLVIGLYGLK